MSKFLSWLWNDDKNKSPQKQQPGTPVSSPRPGGSPEDFLSPSSTANLDKAQKVIHEIEDIIRKEIALLASTKKNVPAPVPAPVTAIENIDPNSSSSRHTSSNPPSPKGSPRDGSPIRNRIRRNSQGRELSGPRLIRSLNKSKQRIIVGEMEYDPVAGVWNGNDEALKVFSKGAPRLIKPDATGPIKESGGMTYDPVQKLWKGNEEELNKFSVPNKAKLGLITNVSGDLLTGLAGTSMVFNAKTLQWENKAGDYEDPFAADDDKSVTTDWEVRDDFALSDALKEQYRLCAKAHSETLSNWFKDSRSKYRTLRTDSLRSLVTARLRRMNEQVEEIKQSGQLLTPVQTKLETKKVVIEDDDWGDVDVSSIAQGGKFHLRGTSSDSDVDRHRTERPSLDSDEDWTKSPKFSSVRLKRTPSHLENRPDSLDTLSGDELPSDTDDKLKLALDKPKIPTTPAAQTTASASTPLSLEAWAEDTEERWSDKSFSENEQAESTAPQQQQSKQHQNETNTATRPHSAVVGVRSSGGSAREEDSELELDVPLTFVPTLARPAEWESAEFEDDDFPDYVPLEREKEVFFEEWSDVDVPNDLPERKPNSKKQKVIISLPTLVTDTFDEISIPAGAPLQLKLDRKIERSEEDEDDDDWNDVVVDKLAVGPVSTTTSSTGRPRLITMDSFAQHHNTEDLSSSGLVEKIRERAASAGPAAAGGGPTWDQANMRWITQDTQDDMDGFSSSSSTSEADSESESLSSVSDRDKHVKKESQRGTVGEDDDSPPLRIKPSGSKGQKNNVTGNSGSFSKKSLTDFVDDEEEEPVHTLTKKKSVGPTLIQPNNLMNKPTGLVLVQRVAEPDDDRDPFGDLSDEDDEESKKKDQKEKDDEKLLLAKKKSGPTLIQFNPEVTVHKSVTREPDGFDELSDEEKAKKSDEDLDGFDDLPIEKIVEKQQEEGKTGDEEGTGTTTLRSKSQKRLSFPSGKPLPMQLRGGVDMTKRLSLNLDSNNQSSQQKSEDDDEDFNFDD